MTMDNNFKSLLFIILYVSFDIFSQTYETHQIKNDSYFITYYIQKPSKSMFPIMVCLQGSECNSVAFDEKRGDLWNATIETFKDDYALVTVEKPGVTKKNIDEKIYNEFHTLDNCVSDVKEVLNQIKKDCVGWNGKIVVLGGSMGVDVAAKIMQDIPELCAAVLISGVQNISFETMVLNSFKKKGEGNIFRKIFYWCIKKYMQYNFYKIKTDKNDQRFCGGYSASFWRSMLDYVNADDIKSITVPLLVLQGNKDDSSPVDGFDSFVRECKQEKYKNIIFKCYEGLGHGLQPEVMVDVKESLTSILNEA